MTCESQLRRRFIFNSVACGRPCWFFLEPAQLVFKLAHADIEAFQNFLHIGWKHNAVRAMVTGGVAALDGIIKFFAAGTAGAGTLTGGDFFHGLEFNLKSEARNPLPAYW